MNPLRETFRAYRQFWPMHRPSAFVLGLLSLPLLGLLATGVFGHDLLASVFLGALCGLMAAHPVMLAGAVHESSLGWALPFRGELRRATFGSMAVLGILVCVRAWTWSGPLGALLGVAVLILMVGLSFMGSEVAVALFLGGHLLWKVRPDVFTSPWVVIPSCLLLGSGLVALGLGNRHFRFRAQRRTPFWLFTSKLLATTEARDAGDRPTWTSLRWGSSWRLPDRSLRSWLRASTFEGSRLHPAFGGWLLPLSIFVVGGLSLLIVESRTGHLWRQGMTWNAEPPGTLVLLHLLPVLLATVALAALGSKAPPEGRGWRHPISRRRMARLSMVGGWRALGITLLVGVGGFQALLRLAGNGPDAVGNGAVLRGAALLVLFFPWMQRVTQRYDRSHPRGDVHPILIGLEAMILALVMAFLHAGWIRFPSCYPTAPEWGLWLVATLGAHVVFLGRARSRYLHGDLA